jgi:hypothetical protein
MDRPQHAQIGFTARFMPALTAIPVLPGFFDGIIQAIPVMGAKGISFSIFVNWTAFLFHHSPPQLLVISYERIILTGDDHKFTY